MKTPQSLIPVIIKARNKGRISRKKARQFIASAYGVSPARIDLLEDTDGKVRGYATFATAFSG